MDPILEILKTRTKTLHEQIEKHVDIPARLESVAAYQKLLAAFYGFYAPLEAKLGDVLKANPTGLDFSRRQKTSRVVADLQCWNIAAAELPLCGDLPEVGSAGAAFGCLYVLEGATLGGQIIKRMLEERLSITSRNGGSFFDVYGDQVGAMWSEFREALSRYATDRPDEREAVVGAACETFAKLDAWLGACLS